jgi:hypothetical protein
MKLKMIMAVIGLTLSAASQAQIVPATTVGGSDLLLDVWEQGASNNAPDQSFTLNLGVTMSQFLAADGSSATLGTLLANDPTWSNFLATSSSVAGDLQWSVVASGAKVPTRASYLASVAVGTDPVAFGSNNSQAINSNTAFSSYIGNLNVNSSALEQTSTAPSASYYMTNVMNTLSSNSWNNGNALGTTGVVFAQASNVGGLASTTAGMNVLPGTLGFTQDASGNYVLSYSVVSAVPEAPGVGMALAGLAALGFLAARRKNA